MTWRRGYDQARRAAAARKKPLLILFQEVPGCGTCVAYGQGVLSHPLIVEAAESLFLPLAVYNNIEGPDRTTLQSFGEKTWNNPVVRIVSPEGRALAPRVADDYTVGGLAAAMVAALKQHDQTVPMYLDLLAVEETARRRGLERATLAMHCFWEGEAHLGRVPGVIKTRPGFLNDLEVVEAEFDPAVIDYAALLKLADRKNCAAQVFTRSAGQQRTAEELVGPRAVRDDQAIRVDQTPKYYLAQTPLRHLPLTELQATRVNAALQPGGPAPTEADAFRRFLSPRQLALLEKIERHPHADWPVAIGRGNLIDTWRRAEVVARSIDKSSAASNR
ncbi:MAG: thioredoxin family protein [Planctomycetes bacterium]|nr:thioredoxin family protein [Planctomycetota bacterium]